VADTKKGMGKWARWVIDKMVATGLWRVVDYLWAGKWSLLAAMVASLLIAAWEVAVSPVGPLLFLVFLGTFVLVFITTNEILPLFWREEETHLLVQRKQMRMLRDLIRRGQGILELYRTSHRPSPFKPDKLHQQWEEEVKTNLHNFFGESYVSRFAGKSEVVTYPGVASEIEEKSRSRYLVFYAQVLQLQKFLDEIERNAKGIA
jgi:hypothetical protein